MGWNFRCWGKNNTGQLGLGNDSNVGDNETAADVPPVELGVAVVQLDSRTNHNCAVLSTGGVRCWGAGSLGRLGYLGTENIGDNELPADAGDVPKDTTRPKYGDLPLALARAELAWKIEGLEPRYRGLVAFELATALRELSPDQGGDRDRAQQIVEQALDALPDRPCLARRKLEPLAREAN